MHTYEPHHKKNLSSGFPIRSDTNQVVQSQNMARGLKFRIWEEDGLYCLFSGNKGVDQPRSYASLFSHNANAGILMTRLISIAAYMYIVMCTNREVYVFSSPEP